MGALGVPRVRGQRPLAGRPPPGVEIDGSGIERTKGAPATVTGSGTPRRGDQPHGTRSSRAVRADRRHDLHRVGRPGGRRPARARLRERRGDPAARSAPGLTQTLDLDRARAIQVSLDRDWLLAARERDRGRHRLHRQAGEGHVLDPPLVAAAYNAGGSSTRTATQNRWSLRQFPIGTGKHCDRFVRFFNDAVAVLDSHPKAPACRIADRRSGDAPPKSRATGGERQKPARHRFRRETRRRRMSPRYSRGRRPGHPAARRSSSGRSSRAPRARPCDQARVMYANCERHGADAQQPALHGAGDKVIAAYAPPRRAGKDARAGPGGDGDEINELGPDERSPGTPRTRRC